MKKLLTSVLVGVIAIITALAGADAQTTINVQFGNYTTQPYASTGASPDPDTVWNLFTTPSPVSFGALSLTSATIAYDSWVMPSRVSP